MYTISHKVSANRRIPAVHNLGGLQFRGIFFILCWFHDFRQLWFVSFFFWVYSSSSFLHFCPVEIETDDKLVNLKIRCGIFATMATFFRVGRLCIFVWVSLLPSWTNAIVFNAFFTYPWAKHVHIHYWIGVSRTINNGNHIYLPQKTHVKWEFLGHNNNLTRHKPQNLQSN